MKYEEFLEQLRNRASSPSVEDRFRSRIAKLAESFDGTSIHELDNEARRIAAEHNRAPRREFDGLSAEEMHYFLYRPLEAGSPIRLRPNLPHEILDGVGFLRLAEELLKIVQRDGSVKLTAKLGALPGKVLLELYGHHFIPHSLLDDGLMKLRYEDDWCAMGSLHAVVRIAKLVRKIHGKLVLTKLGEKMLSPQYREDLFRLVLCTFTRRFDWAYNDFYPDFPLCRDAYAFSLYLIARHGGAERPKHFYAEKFLAAFPMSLAEFEYETRSFSTPTDDFRSCYSLRTFDRFLEWFNFVEVRHHPEADWRHQRSLIVRTETMDAVFKLG